MTAGTTLAERASASAAQAGRGGGTTVFDLIKRMQPQLERALPRAISPERFVRLVITQMRTNPELVRCNPHSLMGAVMSCAQLGLEPDIRGLAYLIPRWNSKLGSLECTMMVGYRGYIDLARRSGTITDIQAHVVYANDLFEFEYGIEPKLRHVPLLAGDRGDRIAVYAVATFRDGGHAFIVLSMADVDSRKKRSQAGDRGPWSTDYDAMARKTAVRALAPYLPQTVELAQANALDETVRTDIDSALEDVRPIDVEGVDGTEGEPGGATSAFGDGEGPMEHPSTAASPSEPIEEAIVVDGSAEGDGGTAPLAEAGQEVAPAVVEEPAEPASAGPPDYDAWTAAALRKECRARGLQADWGKNEAMAAVLRANDAAEPTLGGVA